MPDIAWSAIIFTVAIGAIVLFVMVDRRKKPEIEKKLKKYPGLKKALLEDAQLMEDKKLLEESVHAESSVSHKEDQVDSLARFLLWVGIISAILIPFAYHGSLPTSWLVGCVLVTLFNSIFWWVLLTGGAEVIRLLRRQVEGESHADSLQFSTKE